MNKLMPLADPLPADVAAVLAHYPKRDGYLLKLFRTFANSLRFATKCVPNLLDRESPLSLRTRELVILRITANCHCEYEWGVHVTAFAAAAKLSEAQVEATCQQVIDPALWTGEEIRLLRAIDNLCSSGIIPDVDVAAFEADWTIEQQLEIFALCGTYHTISFVANHARLQNEPFGARFPQR